MEKMLQISSKFQIKMKTPPISTAIVFNLYTIVTICKFIYMHCAIPTMQNNNNNNNNK